jgi:aspartate/methionine/tyrosine aminotransferase
MKLPSFKLERFFARYEFKARYMLSGSDCESMSIRELLDMEPGSDERFHQQWLGYTESPGDPALRQEIARLYEQIDPDEVLVHAGAEEAIFNLMNVLLESGDHLIVHQPGYQSLTEVARSIGCDVTAWYANEHANWDLDIDFLRANIRPNTRIIVINCPHNPTGYLISKAKLRQIIEIAAERNIVVFSDEVYRFLEHNETDTLPAACDLYDNAVSLGVMSKTFGLPGLRIGWITTRNRAFYDQMASYKDYTTICNSAPSEFLATLALRNREKIVRHTLDIVVHNLAILDRFFARHPDLFGWQRPKAGSTAFPSLKDDANAETFCTDLVETKSVLLLPSTCFDYGNRHFRIGYGRKSLPECIDKFEEYIIERVQR